MNEEEFFSENFETELGPIVGIYPHTEDNLDTELIQIETEKIDKKMSRKGCKPLLQPTDEELRYVIRGAASKKTGGKATRYTIPQITATALKVSPITINNRVYICCMRSSVFHANKKNFDVGNIDYIKPIYTDKGGNPISIYMIIITRRMIRK